MKIKSLFTLIISFSLLVILSACGEAKNQDTGFEHAMGKTVLPDNPQRIVILTNEGTEALLALGITPVGAVQSWVGNPWYPHISEAMEGVTIVGTESTVSLEAVLALEPDLIIGNKMRQEDIYEELSDIAPTVFSETLRGQWKNNFMFYAEVLGLETEGQVLINQYDAKMENVKTTAEANNLLDQEIAILRFMAGKTRLYLEDSFSGIILNQVGFNRTVVEDPTGQNFAQEITKEQLLDVMSTSDVIIYFTYENGTGDATATQNEWLNSEIYQSLPAVQAGQAYEVNDAVWNTSGGILAANLTADQLLDFVSTKFSN